MAAGDRNETRLVGPISLPTSNGAVGSVVPTARVWVIKQVTICNASGSDAIMTLAIGTAETTANRFMSNMPIPASDTAVFDTGIVMVAGEQLFGFADRSGVNVIINGWVKEV